VSSNVYLFLSAALTPLYFEETTQKSELESAISIITAAAASTPASSELPRSAPSTDTTVVPSPDNLSQQEVASIRALLVPRGPDPATPAGAKVEAKDAKEDAAFGRVRVGLENMAEAVRETERGYEVSMRIGESRSVTLDRAAPKLARLQVAKRTEGLPVPRLKKTC
jgi:hypothetical protein